MIRPFHKSLLFSATMIMTFPAIAESAVDTALTQCIVMTVLSSCPIDAIALSRVIDVIIIEETTVSMEGQHLRVH